MPVWSEHQTILASRSAAENFPDISRLVNFIFRSVRTIACSCLRWNALAQVLERVRGRSAMSSNRPCGIHANKSVSAGPRRISALETSVLPPAACYYSLLVERKWSISVNQTDTARLVTAFLKLHEGRWEFHEIWLIKSICVDTNV